MLAVMSSEFKARFSDLEKNALYAESTILDPRFKKRVFKNQTAYENALKTLRSKICSISLPNSNANSSEPIPPPPCSSREDNFNLWNEFDLDFTATVQPDNNVVAGIRELDKYLNEEYVSR